MESRGCFNCMKISWLRFRNAPSGDVANLLSGISLLCETSKWLWYERRVWVLVASIRLHTQRQDRTLIIREYVFAFHLISGLLGSGTKETVNLHTVFVECPRLSWGKKFDGNNYLNMSLAIDQTVFIFGKTWHCMNFVRRKIQFLYC